MQPGFNRGDVNPFRVRRLDVFGTDTPRMLLRKLQLGSNDGSLRGALGYYWAALHVAQPGGLVEHRLTAAGRAGMSQGNTMRRGAAWIFAGNTSAQILGFAFGIVLARLLAPEDFGMLLTIQVFTGLAGFVAGGGMGQALVRAKNVNQG